MNQDTNIPITSSSFWICSQDSWDKICFTCCNASCKSLEISIVTFNYQGIGISYVIKM
jgi:hypothetical protein